MSKPGVPSDSSQVSLNDIFPNEVQRQILLYLSPIQRKNVDRVQKIWQFLNNSIKPSEEILENQMLSMLAAAATGNYVLLRNLLTPLEYRFKATQENRVWMWLALRLAAQNGHFECMPLLIKHYTSSVEFGHEQHPYFFKEMRWHEPSPIPFTNEEQVRISKNIDTMPEQDKSEEWLESKAMQHFMREYPFQALQVFIANDQVKFMDHILSQKNHSFSISTDVKKDFLRLMVSFNRSQCLNLSLNSHYYHSLLYLDNQANRQQMLQNLIAIAAEKGALESLCELLLLTPNIAGDSIHALPWACEIAMKAAKKNRHQDCIDFLTTTKTNAVLQLDPQNDKKRKYEEEGESDSNKKSRSSKCYPF